MCGTLLLPSMSSWREALPLPLRMLYMLYCRRLLRTRYNGYSSMIRSLQVHLWKRDASCGMKLAGESILAHSSPYIRLPRDFTTKILFSFILPIRVTCPVSRVTPVI
jgi:hypothetical protein